MVDHKIDQSLHDFKERKLRKNNLILYNLPESNALESADVPDDIVRLVERKTENRAKPRPVKVIFYSENTRGKFLINSKKLRDVSEFKKVTVTPDYTFRQRKMNNQIKSEVASRRQTHPIFNLSGNSHGPCNYRPVSLTYVPCKLFEKKVRDRVVSHLTKYDLFSNAQYGFRSCALQLLDVMEEWTEWLGEGKSFDCIC